LNKLIALCAILVAAGVLLVAFVYSGLYDVGADQAHSAPVQVLLTTLRDRSIEHRAHDVVVPALDEPARVREGAEHYSAMCVDCHLAPGITVSEIRAGLLPHPPNLSRQVIDPRIAFWAIKHGIKATGMPAWGQTHDDEEIWNIVSFVHQLPHMTPEEYRAMTTIADSTDHEAADDEHQHARGGQNN
jgi:mono/diheme cytochrome c family protein